MREVETTSIVNSKAYTLLSLCSSVAGLWYLAPAGEVQTTRYIRHTRLHTTQQQVGVGHNDLHQVIVSDPRLAVV